MERRILWLIEVGSSSNDPRIIATFYHGCVKQLGGPPHICRADAATENVHVAAMQRFLRRHALHEFIEGGRVSFTVALLQTKEWKDGGHFFAGAKLIGGLTTLKTLWNV